MVSVFLSGDFFSAPTCDMSVNSHAIQVARYILGLSWIYQGFFPKLYAIAPLERQLTATMGFTPEASDMITRGAGVSEIIFGLFLIVGYRNRTLHMLNILALLGLLAYVVVMMPSLLLEAFNPVTTNLPLIVLSVVLISSIKSQDSHTRKR